MLRLKNVAKLYGAKLIFKDVSCTLAPGTVSLLVGSNGAGKSTLMRIMAGLSRPSAGEIERADVGLGYLGHATFLYPGLSALENLVFWRSAHGLHLRKEELMALLERVGLAAHAHERAGIFSRGMAQRLNLARVLMLKPQLLLLDEPGSGLDTASLVLLREEVRMARQDGACIVFITHDLQGDAPLADRLLALSEGRLVYDGSPTTFAGFVGDGDTVDGYGPDTGSTRMSCCV